MMIEKKVVLYDSENGVSDYYDNRKILTVINHPDFRPYEEVITTGVLNEIDGVIETKNTIYIPAARG